jgi:hypothetical protein
MARLSWQLLLPAVLSFSIAATFPAAALPGETAETAFRVDVVGSVPGATEDGVTAWIVEVAPPPLPEAVTVEAAVVLVTRIEPCVSEPSACDGSESFFAPSLEVYGCQDWIDNDADGGTDADDPDCRGTKAWSLSVATDPCFGIRQATTRGTVADLDIRPPGRREPGASFEKTEVVDPERNGGQEGAVSTAVLSFVHPRILPQVGESVVLRLGGLVRTADLGPGEESPPCLVRAVPPAEDGLRGSGEPVQTAVSIAGETSNPDIVSAAIRLRVAVPSPFVRGDADGDGEENITDGIVILRFLFRGGVTPSCRDAADADDNGKVEMTDAIRILNFLFLGGPAHPAPFFPHSSSCGADPTADALGCEAFAACT